MGRRDFFWGDQGAPGLGLAGALLVALAIFFWAAGALPPEELPSNTTSASETVGMALMLILIPPYMLAAWCIGQQRSLELVEELRPLVPDSAETDAAREAIRKPLGARGWFWGSSMGLAFGLVNTSLVRAFTTSTTPVIDGSINFGQLFLWWIIGLLMVDRARTARAFRRLGQVIRFDLFKIEALRPLARSGIVDVVIVTGALLFSPLQALDAEFRAENYRFALSIATPAMLFFVLWPLRAIHLRLRAERARRIEAVEAQLDGLGSAPASNVEATTALEALLAHRDRLLDARTWPLDLRLLSRIFIYLIIPPMAWAGAALVERLVNTALEAG